MKQIIKQLREEVTELGLRDCMQEERAFDILATLDRLEKQLKLCGVSKSVAKEYAEFCVRCDREGLPLLELDDYIKQYCC